MKAGDATVARVGKIMLDVDPNPSGGIACKWIDGIGVILDVMEANVGSNRCWVQVLCPYGIGWCFDNELVIIQERKKESARRPRASNEQR
jgi:hypothetical protein